MTQLVYSPADSLRLVSSDVINFDDQLTQLVSNMVDTMYSNEGVGLAAPQVGVSQRVILADPSGGNDSTQLLVCVNPTIVAMHGKQFSTEGCLSVPGVVGEVERAAEITLVYFDVTGCLQQRNISGFLAAIVQHEIDHLNGILFTDKIKGIRKLTMRTK